MSSWSSLLPCKLPGFIKAIANKAWVDRNHRNRLADFKALAEAKVPAHA